VQNTPNHTLADLINYHFVKRITFFKPLYYIDYNKPKTMELLERELGWKYYGGHHYESIYTRFIHGYYLPTKFGIDKRKIEYSALIRSNQMTRDEALEKLQAPTYDPEMVNDDIRYVISKLGITEEEYDAIMRAETKRFIDYDTYY